MSAPASGGEPGLTIRVAAFWRLLHPLPSLLTVLVAGALVLMASRGEISAARLLYVLLIETGMQFSISAFNDYFDRHVDIGRAGKPVASGLVSPREAVTVGTVLGLAALALAVPLGWWVFALTAVGLGGGLLYDTGLKYTVFSWLPFAISFPTLPLWAWAVVSPTGDFPVWLLWVVPVTMVLVVGIHLADTIPDLDRDTEAGVRGLAHTLGLERSLALCRGAFAAAAVLTLALLPFLKYRLEWYLPGLGLGLALMLAGTGVYKADRTRLKVMSLLMELGGIALGIGWLGAVAP